MAERKRHDFSDEVRHDVRDDQRSICADCGTVCRGGHSKLQVHHVLPQSLGGSTERANAVGLCPRCHDRHDQEALCNGRLFYQVLMDEGRWCDVSRMAQIAGIPAPLLEAPNALKRHLTRKDAPLIVQQQNRENKALENVVFYDQDPNEEWVELETTGKTYRSR